MKKFGIVSLIVLTIFGTYFYIPSFNGIANKNVEKTLAAGDEYYYFSTCDRGINNLYKSSYVLNTTTLESLRFIQGAKEVEIQYSYSNTKYKRYFKFLSYSANTVRYEDKNMEGVYLLAKTGPFSNHRFTIANNINGLTTDATQLHNFYQSLGDPYRLFAAGFNNYDGPLSDTPVDDPAGHETPLGAPTPTEVQVNPTPSSPQSNNFNNLINKTFAADSNNIDINPETCMVFQNGPIHVDIFGAKDGSMKPYITMQGAGGDTTDNGKKPGLYRPAMKLELTDPVLKPEGIATTNSAIFNFKYVQTVELNSDGSIKSSGAKEEKYNNVGVKVIFNEDAWAVSFGNLRDYADDSDKKGDYFLTGYVGVTFNNRQSLYDYLLNLVFNISGGDDGGKNPVCGGKVGPRADNKVADYSPDKKIDKVNCLNGLDGWLLSWGISVLIVSSSDSTGEKKNECPVYDYMLFMPCVVASWFRNIAKGLMCFSQSWLRKSLSVIDISPGSPSSACDAETNNDMPDVFK